MTWRRRFLTQSNFLSTTSLACISGISVHPSFCSVRRSLYGDGNKHTHIHIHTEASNKASFQSFVSKVEIQNGRFPGKYC